MRIDRRQLVQAGLVGFGGIVIGASAPRAEANPMPEELRAAIERQGDAPVLGNPDGDITLTEFFDYNCGFCKQVMPVLHALILEDRQLRVVLREWPIFGEGSYVAAQASLAALGQGRYWEFHAGLMRMKGRAEEASVMRVAGQVGLDLDRLRSDMTSERVLRHIDHSNALADHMGLAGTPTFIAGNDGRFGGQTAAELRALVAQARADLG